MRICISITDDEALKIWLAIPKYQRSRFVEEALLGKPVLYGPPQEEYKDIIEDVLNLD